MCSHCMENSLPTEPHMEWSTLRDAVKFMNFNKVSVVVITGGEPTCDPEFEDKVRYLHEKMPGTAFTIQSNGSFIFDEAKTVVVARVLDLPRVLMMQVSTNRLYYPNYEKLMERKSDLKLLSSKIQFASNWQGTVGHIHRLGRAVNLKDFVFDGNPSCSPIFSRANQLDRILSQMNKNMDDASLFHFIKLLEMSNYLCKPLINNTGTIHIGECPTCVKIGDVTGFSKLSEDGKAAMSHGVLMSMVNGRMCDKCGQVKNLKGKVPDKVLETKSFKDI